VLSPIYARLVELLPTSIAPNVITLAGLGFAAAGHLTVVFLACGGRWSAFFPFAGSSLSSVPESTGATKRFDLSKTELDATSLLFGVSESCSDSIQARFAYGFAALCLGIYQVLDNLDGRQARRTGSSSPLGHLFDHGCDAINVALTGITFALTIQLGWTMWTTMLVLFVGMMPFFFATLEEYFTGALVLREVNGPNEGLLLMQLMTWITAIVGPEFWRHPVIVPLAPAGSATNLFRVPQKISSLLSSGGYHEAALLRADLSQYHERLRNCQALAMPLNRVFFLCTALPVLPTILLNLSAIIRDGRGLTQSQRKARRSYTARRMLEYSAPFWILAIAMLGWPLSSPSIMLTYGLVYHWLCGLTFFYICSRLILAHLTSSVYGSAFLALMPLWTGFLNALLGGILPENWVLIAAFLFMLFVVSRRVLGVVREISAFLGIHPFKVGGRPI
jgi:ethanolaminephosphotransferase